MSNAHASASIWPYGVGFPLSLLHSDEKKACQTYGVNEQLASSIRFPISPFPATATARRSTLAAFAHSRTSDAFVLTGIARGAKHRTHIARERLSCFAKIDAADQREAPSPAIRRAISVYAIFISINKPLTGPLRRSA
jgi:hypothetical protein